MSGEPRISNVELLERTIKQAKILSEEIAQLTIELNRSKKQLTSGSSSETVTRSYHSSESTPPSGQGPSTPQRSPQSTNATSTPIAAVRTPQVSTSNSDTGSSADARHGAIVKTTTTVITAKDREEDGDGESLRETGQFDSPTHTQSSTSGSPRRRVVHKRVVRYRRGRRGTSPWSPWKQISSFTKDEEREYGSEDEEEEGSSRAGTTRGRAEGDDNGDQQKKNYDDERAYLQAEIARLMKVEARLRKELEEALEQEKELEREMSSSKRRDADTLSTQSKAGEKIRARLREELAELVEMERDLEERIKRYTEWM